MKRRDHTAPVSCLLAAVVFLLIQGAAVAQEFMPPPAGYPGTPSLVVGRFYIQAGVQYRNVTRFAFERGTRTVLNPYQWGVPPFGPDRQNYWDAFPFGSGTGTPGYPPVPTGAAGTDPNTSGIWTYNNGAIDPNGDSLWPTAPFTTAPLPGLGQHDIDPGTVWQVGIFTVSAPSSQVGNGTSVGFDPLAPPNMNQTFSITWQRVMDATVTGEDGGPGLESILYQYNGRQFNQEYQTNIWSPSIELGFQWTNFFDLFTAFSWYDISRNLSQSFTGGTTDLVRRAFRDTFPYSSDYDVVWPTSPYSSNTIIGGDGNSQINPDSPGVIGYPRRQFFLVNYGLGNATASETINLHSDVRVYEWRSGVRSWVPLYGMGRFGVTFGPMMSLLSWNASEHGIYTFVIPNVPEPSVFETLDHMNGTLTSFGLFGGLDVELAMNRWYAKFTGQYNLSEQKALANSPNTDTNVNLSGFTYIVSGGLRF